VGLFSVLDVLLDRPMEELVRSLSLTPQVQQALVAREGPFGETLQIVIDYEQGRWTEFDREDFDRPTIVKAYLDALALTDEMTRVLGHRA
jgi:EAL and modified HD-GYP domain-containing signal transduction protein